MDSSSFSTLPSSNPFSKNSINHPSIDHDLDTSLRRAVVASARRLSPMHSVLEHSFVSEPLPEKMVRPDTRSARSDEGCYGGPHSRTHDADLGQVDLIDLDDSIFSDPPSETRQRLELSLSNIRRLQSRPNSRVSSMSEKQEITPKDAQWQQHMMDHIDKRYNGILSSFDERFQALEVELQAVQNDMQQSRVDYEQLRELSATPMVDRDVQTMLEGPVVSAEETVKLKQKMKTLETTMADLESSHDKDWKTKAKTMQALQSFVDRVDHVMWETPYISMTQICPDTPTPFEHDDLCEMHRVRYEKALLAATRDKTKALDQPLYTNERLDATFERLVRWSHAVRQHTQPTQ